MTAMLHFLWLLIITHISPSLLSLDRRLFIDNANFTLEYQLKMLNMMQIGIRDEAERQSVRKYTLGITVVILDSEVYCIVDLILSRTWILSVCSLHSVLTMRYLKPMNINSCYLLNPIERTFEVQVISLEENFEYDENYLRRSARIMFMLLLIVFADIKHIIDKELLHYLF